MHSTKQKARICLTCLQGREQKSEEGNGEEKAGRHVPGMWYTCYYLPGPVNNAHTRIKNGLITVRTVSASVMCVCVISTRGKCKSRETKKRRNKRINCWFYLFSCFLFWMVPSVLDTVHSYKKCSQRIAEFCFFFKYCVCVFFLILAFTRSSVTKTRYLFNFGKLPLFVTQWAHVSGFQPALNAIQMKHMTTYTKRNG